MVAVMVPFSIEKEVVIEAPVDVVWEVVTQPDHIRQWFADEAEVDLRAGGAGRLTFPGQKSYDLQVEAVEPPHKFAFRWVRRPGAVVHADNSLLVEFTLQPEYGKTRLRVVESGFEAIDWSDDELAAYVEDHTRGWQRIMGQVRDYALKKDARR
jgi:uncharacterized protein YndB with AHSA1/START domain